MIKHPATSLKDIDLLVENLQYKCISKISVKEFSPPTHMLLGDVSDYLTSQRSINYPCLSEGTPNLAWLLCDHRKK